MGMMTWKQSVLTTCGNLMADFYRPPAGVLLPSGHIVSDLAPPHVRYVLRVPSISKFQSDIEFLAKHYQPLPLSRLEQVRYREKGPARYFVLSFDDGMREVYDVIAPTLYERGIPAIFFLNSATIDNKELMWRHKVSLLIARVQQKRDRVPPLLHICPGETLSAKLLSLRFADRHILDEIAGLLEVDFDEYLRSARPYLTIEQMLKLARQGFEFGAHSASHPCFNEISVEEQKEQISSSVQFIRSLGLPCRYFAFPFHDNGVPASVFKYMTGMDIALSFGTSEARVDSLEFSVQRFALDAENTDWSVPDLLKQLSAKSVARRLSRTEVIWRN